MKKFISPSIALALCLCFLTACATTYKAAVASKMTVQAAMAAWESYVKVKHPSAAVEQQVKNAFDQWKAAELLVISAGQIASTNTSPTAQQALGMAAGFLTDQSSNLTWLVQSITTK